MCGMISFISNIRGMQKINNKGTAVANCIILDFVKMISYIK